MTSTESLIPGVFENKVNCKIYNNPLEIYVAHLNTCFIFINIKP